MPFRQLALGEMHIVVHSTEDPTRIAAFGYSAGGHLAALLATSDPDDGLEGETAFPGTSSRVQALVAGAAYGTPRRTTIGMEDGRVALLLAVLDRRTDVDLLSRDVYVNVAGGVRVGTLDNFFEIFDGPKIARRVVVNPSSKYHGRDPDELVAEWEANSRQARELGTDPKSGKPVTVRMGRYGPHVQIGTREDAEKPRFAGAFSIPAKS